MAENDSTASNTTHENLSKAGAIERPHLNQIIDEHCISMDAFLDLAMGEIEKHNNSDFDGLKFLAEAAKTKLLDFVNNAYGIRRGGMTDAGASPRITAAVELAKQYPCNAEPFKVWYSFDEVNGRGCWAVNNEEGVSVYETISREDADKLSRALSGCARGVQVSDIWMAHAQTIATIAMVDSMSEIDHIEASQEFPAVRAMLRDLKRRLELLAVNADSAVCS